MVLTGDIHRIMTIFTKTASKLINLPIETDSLRIQVP